MNELFNVGDIVYGFCNGYFGRDDYETKICVMVNSKYAVFQYMEQNLWFATVLNDEQNLNKKTVDSWKYPVEYQNLNF